MNQFKEISPEEIDRVLERIGKEWMLVSAGDTQASNTMTASWGCMGVLWNRPVAICFIRPQRYTYTFTETHDRLSLSFFGGEYKEALTLCGRTSGRDGDKFERAHLTRAFSEAGVPYPGEAELVLICKKLYVDDLKKASFLDPALLSNYPADDFHRVYVCEIERALRKI